jgi:hypothetical protein
MMNAIGGITRAGFVWLTAITTLVAGLPHFQCQCPDGSIKPSCIGVFCSSSGCCCGDVCCGAKDSSLNAGAVRAGKGRPACCAHRFSQPTPDPSDRTPRVEGRGCTNSLAQQQQLSPSAQPKVVDDRSVAHRAFLTRTAVAPLGSSRHGTDAGGLHLAAPPPPDLVVVLQRFLI